VLVDRIERVLQQLECIRRVIEVERAIGKWLVREQAVPVGCRCALAQAEERLVRLDQALPRRIPP